MNRVTNKVALVTGGAMGIGRACAELLSAEGASVIITDRDAENGRRTSKALSAEARRVEFLNHDVSSEEDWIRVIASTRTIFGRLDILVNNAGVGRTGDVEHTSLDEWQNLLAINLDGVFLGIKHAIPAMRESGGGSIINMSSICRRSRASSAIPRWRHTTPARARFGFSRNPQHSTARRAARTSA